MVRSKSGQKGKDGPNETKVFVAFACFSVWTAAYGGFVLSGTERLARAGELDGYFHYKLDSVGYAATFLLAVVSLTLVSSSVCPWSQLPQRIRLVQAAAFSVPVFYGVWQIIWRAKDLVLASVARKCLALDVSHVSVLGFSLACEDARAYVYPAEYVKVLPYAMGSWAVSTVGIVVQLVVMLIEKERVIAEEGDEKLDEKLDEKVDGKLDEELDEA